MKRIQIVFLAMSILAVIAVVAYVARFGAETVEEWPSGSVVAVQGLEHDWGDINIQGGDVEHVFEFENDSSKPLEITGALTSCMCTTAAIEIDGERVSPKFGMHDEPGQWSHVIPAGESFSVRAVFDPLAHGPDATGPIRRDVELFTSAEADGDLLTDDARVFDGSVATVTLAADVLSEKEFTASQEEVKEESSAYPIEIGDFMFSEEEHDFGLLKQSGGKKSHVLKFTYQGSKPITVTGTPTSCPCTEAEISTTSLEPGDEGELTVRFDPNLHEEPEGRFFKTISIEAEPKLEKSTEVKIWAEIDLDLGPEAYKLTEPHDD